MRLSDAIAAYERANLDEHGPLATAGFSAFYRSGQGLAVSRIAPVTEEGNEEAAAFCRRFLTQLDELDGSALEGQERLSLAVLRSAIERREAASRYYWYEPCVTPYRSFIGTFRSIFRAFDVESDEARTRYLAVIRDVGLYARAVRAKVAGQVERGIVLPRRAIPPIVALHRAAVDAVRSPFLPPPEKLAVLDETLRARFLNDAQNAIRTEVSPALQELADDLAGAYLAAASDTIGQSSYPGGAGYYDYLVRANTTLDLDAKTIHERGLSTVDALRNSMAEQRERLGFRGSAPEFHFSLRHDARFVPTRAEQIGDRLELFARRADDVMPALFSKKPSAPFGVKRLPPDLEGGMTFGYYQPGAKAGETGYYIYNGSKLEERSLLSLASLALHELVPGHHYEISISRENESLPRFRAFQSISTYIAAYHEGWAEYAADLGKELGIYEDPYDLYGRYALDIFISSRLVVDTGLNALGWSLERAAEFMRTNTLMSETEIDSELLRYATDLPAQSLSYKLGSLTFADLREKARTQLGSAFDVRAFHERIVQNGGMPLTLVKAEIDRFIGGDR
ncbi:MAG TPA: DUF885 domain-containing protein [Candidatus Baltobacteraceae bacterium]|nr:DUF885 domain-containing protein [Candidatus Baltobacteraceae bacterium]